MVFCVFLGSLLSTFCLSSWCLLIVMWLFLTVPKVGLQCVIVVFPDHTHLLFSILLLVHAFHNATDMFSLMSCTSTTAESRAKIWYK